jgi:hypothetical protein
MNNMPSLYWEALAELNKREAMRSVLSVSEKPTDEKFAIPVVPETVESITVECVYEGRTYRGTAYLVEEQA